MMIFISLGKRLYETDVRLCVYNLIKEQVPITHITAEISAVLKNLVHVDVGTLPSQGTISNTSLELGVICDVHSCQRLLASDFPTLGWDATSLDGHHVNTIHFQEGPKSSVLSITTLAGGTAVDYVDHITTMLTDITSVHGQFTGEDPAKVLEAVRNKFSRHFGTSS